MKYKYDCNQFKRNRLNQLKKPEQVIVKAMKEIPYEKVGFTELLNDITNAKIYFLVYNAKPYIDIDFLVRKLELTKEQIFNLIDEDNILADSYTYREGRHYYLGIDDALLLVKESNLTNKQKHRDGLQYVFDTALEKYAKSVEFKIACKKLKLK